MLLPHRFADEIIVVDIDGTLADVAPRAKQYLKKGQEDWDAFYRACASDAPICPVIDIVSALSQRYDIVLCSGRRNSCCEATMVWLNKYAPDLDYSALLLRKDGDHRHDTEVKPELLGQYIEECHRLRIRTTKVVAIVEDRDSMVAKWRELGYTCFQPAPGNF